jgi:hypothetical protein
MRFVTIMVLLLITGLLFGCGGGGSSSAPITIQQQQTPMAVFIAGSVIDADTRAGVTATVTVVGGTLYSQSGAALPASVVTQSNGNVTYALPTAPNSDLTLTITASAPNYVPNSTTVTLSKNPAFGKVYQFQIALVSTNPANNPAGVGSAKVTGTTATAPLNVAAQEATSGAATNVTIPTGAVASAGATPLSGSLTLTASTYNPTDPNALGLFPGGLNNVNAGGSTVAFITTGFTDVSVHDANGNAATKLDKPMTVRMNIAPGAINPETKVALKAGDLVPVWTYKADSATWVPEPSTDPAGVVVKTDPITFTLYVEFTANHFSYWNLGFIRGASCTGTINLTSVNSTDHLVGLTFKATGPPAVGTLFTGQKPPGDATVTMRNVPASYALTVRAYFGTSTTPVGTTSVATNCNVSNPMLITLPVTLVTYTWNVVKKCNHTSQTQPVPNVTIWSCPPGTLTLQPFPTCTIVAATNGSGVATVDASPTDVLFFQPSDASSLGLQTSCASCTPPDPCGNPIPGPGTRNIKYCGNNWDFCTITGGSYP